MFEYKTNRFLNPQRIIAANVYQKDDQTRVAIDLDVLDTNMKTVYTDSFTSMEAAKSFCVNLPIPKK